MKSGTRLLLAAVAAWALSICPAWGDIANGDFSDGLTGWTALAWPMDDTSLAEVTVVDEQLQMHVANSYAYDESTGWQLQESDMSAAYVLQDIAPNGDAPLGTTSLTFDADIQFLDNPVGNTGAVVRVFVNYGGYASSQSVTATTSGMQTFTIDLPGLIPNDPVLDMYMEAYSALDILPDPALGTSYNIVVDATLDNFEFVAEQQLLEVDIDIRPHRTDNIVKLDGRRAIPVAIFSTDTFDAMDIDPLTVTLADAGARMREDGTPMFHMRDLNEDGLDDMVLRIETDDLVLAPDATEAWLRGETFDGLAFEGVDMVSIWQSGSQVPEPSTIMLLVLGGMGVLRRRRLRRDERN